MTSHRYLNIGRRTAKIPNFIDIDLESEAEVRHGWRQKLPYDDATIDGIYTEDFVQRLTQNGIIAFLRECRRVLRPGGRVRITTPDLATLATEYVNNDWQQHRREKYGHSWIRGRAEYLNVCMREWDHQWLVDEEELSRLADWAGLTQAARCSPNESADVHLSGLETRSEPTLIMEYSKRDDFVDVDSLVSIIVPAYRAEFLAACLESAIAQTHQHIEVLIVDDCPSDAVERVSAEYVRRDRRISYHRNSPPLGEPDNLMRCIRMARGTFVKPLYDDDLLEPDAIERLLATWRASPDARLAAGRRRPMDASGKLLNDAILGRPLSLRSGRLRGTEVISEILSSGLNSLGEPTCMMFRRSDALSIDEPNVMSLFGQLCFGVGDVCLATHLLSRGDLAYVAEPIAYFRVHPGQTQRQRWAQERGTEAWRYLRAMGPRLGFTVAPLTQASGLQAAPARAISKHHFSYAYQAYTYGAAGQSNA